MFNKGLVFLSILLAVCLGMIFWIDNQMSGQNFVLGEKITNDQESATEDEELNKENSEEEIKGTINVTIENNLDSSPSQAVQDDIKVKNDIRKYFEVIKVVDGDTVDVKINGKTERLRLIGINTPETVDPRKPVECFGREASAKAKELLLNQKVFLEADDTQDERDKYGRLLRYLYREDGLFYNLEIIKQGYAYEYTYQVPYIYQQQFKAAEDYARENKLGLWAEGACQ